eukprot:gene9768-10610_t
MKAVVVFGSAGAGKSTLIRELTGSDLPVVSHRKFRDGTETITVVPVAGNPGLSFIDTPGLDSANFPTKMSEQIQTKVRDREVLAVLVVNKGVPRITSFIKKFEAVLEDLFGNSQTTPFLFLWSGTGTLDEQDRTDARRRFPRALFHELNGDLAGLNQTINNSPFAPMRVRTVPMQPLPLPAVPSAPRPKKKQPSVPSIAPTILVCARSLSTVEKFERLSPDRDLSTVIEEVLHIKKENPLEYQNMKLMGDAFLRFFTLSYLKKIRDEREELHTKMLRIIGNDETCPMPKFFDKYLKAKHDQIFPREANMVSSHGKADVVEALIDLVRSRSDKNTKFRFIFSELMK